MYMIIVTANVGLLPFENRKREPILRHQSELSSAVRINFLFIAEGDRLQRQNCFAGSIDRMDLVLEPCGRDLGSKSASNSVKHYGVTAPGVNTPIYSAV